MTLPLQALESALNKRVSVALKDHRVLEGTLVGFDEHMNLVVADASDRAGGALKRLGTVVLRGSNVLSISPE